MKVQREEASYAAGLVDADGSIMVYKHQPAKPGWNPHHGVKVSVGSTVYRSLAWLIERWEGATNEVSTSTSYKQGRKFKFWEWRLYSDKAERFLRDIRPYLLVKDVEADLALDFLQKRLPSPGSGQKLPPEEIEKRDWYQQRIREAHDARRILLD